MAISESSHRRAAKSGSQTRSSRSLSTSKSSATRGTSIHPHPARVGPRGPAERSSRADFAVTEPNCSGGPFRLNTCQRAGSPSLNDQSLDFACKSCSASSFRWLGNCEPQLGCIAIWFLPQEMFAPLTLRMHV